LKNKMQFFKKTNTNKKGVIFDFDDTIAKTRTGKNMGLKIISSKIYDYFKKKGIDINFNKLHKEIQNAAQELDTKRIYDRNLWWSCVIKKFSKEKPQKSFLDEITKNYWEIIIKKSDLYKDTSSVLLYLKNKGYALGMLTDTDGVKGLKLKRIEILNLIKWFDSIVVAGEDTKQTKPDKPPFSLISRRLNLRPKECVFVGNDLYRDFLGAEKAGMTAILIKRQNSKIKVKPDRVIKQLNKLKEIL